MSLLGSLGSIAGGAIGSALLPGVGTAIGSAVGGAAGNKLGGSGGGSGTPQGGSATSDPLGGYGSIVKALMSTPQQSTAQTDPNSPGNLLQMLMQMSNVNNVDTPIPAASPLNIQGV